MALTDEQIAQEEKFLAGMPRFNIAAFLLPPVWGPAHGMWAAIVFTRSGSFPTTSSTLRIPSLL